ncbi:MAG: calcium-binding protein [Steroidobacteraceae bacterium]
MAAITALNAGYFSAEAYEPIGDANLGSALSGWTELTALAGATKADGTRVPAEQIIGSAEIANQYRVFVNTESHQIVFAFKGSDHAENWWSDIANSGASAYDRLQDQSIRSQANVAYDLLTTTSLYSQYAGYQIVTVGHSLGGGMAQSFALERRLDGFGVNSLPISDQVRDELSAEGKTVASYSHTFIDTYVKGDIARSFYATRDLLGGGDYLDANPTYLESNYLAAELGMLTATVLSGGVASVFLGGGMVAAAGKAHTLDAYQEAVKKYVVGAGGELVLASQAPAADTDLVKSQATATAGGTTVEVEAGHGGIQYPSVSASEAKMQQIVDVVLGSTPLVAGSDTASTTRVLGDGSLKLSSYGWESPDGSGGYYVDHPNTGISQTITFDANGRTKSIETVGQLGTAVEQIPVSVKFTYYASGALKTAVILHKTTQQYTAYSSYSTQTAFSYSEAGVLTGYYTQTLTEYSDGSFLHSPVKTPAGPSGIGDIYIWDTADPELVAALVQQSQDWGYSGNLVIFGYGGSTPGNHAQQISDLSNRAGSSIWNVVPGVVDQNGNHESFVSLANDQLLFYASPGYSMTAYSIPPGGYASPDLGGFTGPQVVWAGGVSDTSMFIQKMYFNGQIRTPIYRQDNFLDYQSNGYNALFWHVIGYNLTGGEGDDSIGGDTQDNVLDGGNGDDHLAGGAGADSLLGGAGKDFLWGDAGADTLVGGRGDDYLEGDSSSTAAASQGNDYLDGGDGNDVLIGDGGNDTLLGGVGNDTLDGGNGDDILNGGAGNDAIYGGAGNDIIYAGAGTDYLSGDAGNDTYIFSSSDLQPVNNVIDTVVDTQGNDKIIITDGWAMDDLVLSGVTASTVQIRNTSGSVALSIANSNINLQFSDGQTLTLAQLVGQRRQGAVNVTTTTANAILLGGYDNDSITALGANATLSGGLGNDQLIGSASENTTFLYSRGDNNDSLGDHSTQAADGSGPINTLVLSDINLANLKIQDRDGQRFLIVDSGGSLQVGTATTDVVGDRVLDRIQFADGSTMTWAEVVAALGVEVLGTDTGSPTVISGTTANDRIVGGTDDETINTGAGDDQLDGGAGNDVMNGGAGSDTYLFGVGSGQDIINNTDIAVGKVDRLVLASTLTPSQVQFLRSDNALVVQLVNSTDTLVVTNYFNGAGLDQIVFANGTIYTPANIVLTPFSSVPSIANDWVIGTSGNDTIDVLAGNDTVFAGDGNDTVFGGSGNDTLDGGMGNDFLDGGTGVDHLTGGAGNDIYVVDNTGDVVVENASEGTDLVQSSITYTLGGNVEYLTLTGTAAINGTGNDIANIITGNSGNNYLTGAGGNDTLNGADGNDDLWAGNGSDFLYGGSGNDWMVGDTESDEAGSGSDFMDGGDGNDTLWGEAGADTLYGGDGNDTLLGDGNGVSVAAQGDDYLDGGSGDDSLYGYGGNDTLLGGTGNDAIYGGNGNDALQGGDGDDRLYGEGGNDVLDGGSGNDTLYGVDSGDTVLFGRGDGNDSIDGRVIQFKSGVLPDDIKIVAAKGNDLTLSIVGTTDTIAIRDYFNVAGGVTLTPVQLNFSDGGSRAITPASMAADLAAYTASSPGSEIIVGNDLGNTITGSVYDDLINGRKGADTQIGGAGNDIYVVDMDGSFDTNVSYNSDDSRLRNFQDSVVEGADEGADTLIAYHVYSATLPDNVENMIVDGVANYTVWRWVSNGYYVDDTRRKFTGNALDNVIDARMAVTEGVGSITDKYSGSGAGGEIVIDGGLGADTMIGGDLPTRFIVDNVGDTVIAGSSNRDRVVSSVNYVLTGAVEYLDLVGSAATSGTGNTLNNTINGSLNSAANILSGGAGDDTYIVGAGDVVIEGIGEGADTIQSASDYTLGINVENLILTSDYSWGTGNALDNVITGNSGTNYLNGRAGNDRLVGGSGIDTYFGFGIGSGNDVIVDNGISMVEFSESTLHVDDLQFTRSGDDLRIGISPSDSITLQDWFGASGNRIGTLSLTENGEMFRYTTDQIESRAAGVNSAPVVWYSGLGLNVEALLGFEYGVPVNTFMDIESQHSLTYGATMSDGSALPSWFGFDATTGAFSGVPPEAMIGVPLSIAITATDAGGLTSFTSLEVTVTPPSIRGTAGNDMLTGDAGDNVIYGLEGDDSLNGLDGNDQLYGGVGNDASFGGAGDDYIDDYEGGDDLLDGGTGADEMYGGQGDDTYVVNDVGDYLWEEENEGIDTVKSSITYTLDGNVENLTLTGSAAINGIGNELDNILTGNSGNNTLYGLDGDDTLDGGSAGTDSLRGGLGNDTYIVSRSSGISITENSNEGIDAVNASVTYTLGSNLENLVLTGTSAINGTGNSLANSIIGNSANNTLSGGTGADTMAGGAGNDTYVVDNAGDVVIENVSEGTDLVQSSVTYTLSANVENLTLTGSSAINGTGNALDNVLTGNSGNNTLTGGDGNDTLDGGSGSDTMLGGLGNDTYVVAQTGDVVTENANEGTDLVQSSITYTLGSNVENLTLTGTSAINGTGNNLDNILTGNSANNTLTGGAGNDIIDGGSGTDTMVGGTGDDVYFVNVSGDVTTENANEGIDTVNSSVTRTLAANIELLFLTGTSAINGTGNTLANLLRGNTANNTLAGAGGTDILEGGAGNDVLSNTSGNTLLNGGAGTDTLTGAGNNDLLIGGAGNDAITTGQGADIIAFNKGDGQDTVAVSTTKDNTLSIGGGTNYADLVFQKSGSNLILKVGASDQITFTNYYASTSNRSVNTLQVVLEGSTDYNANSTDAMYNKKVETFDFGGLVAAFDAALVANPSLTSWSLSNALLAQYLSGSDTAAMGGDLAYQYGRYGNEANVSYTPAIGILGSTSFGTAAQTLQALASLQDSSPRLS